MRKSPETDPTAARLYSPADADALVPHLEAAFSAIARHRSELNALMIELETHGLGGVEVDERLVAVEQRRLLVEAADNR